MEINEEAQLRTTLQIAERKRVALIEELSRIERDLATQNKLIIALSEALGRTPEFDIGLTDSIRIVLEAANTPLSTAEIRDELKLLGYDISEFSNPLATLNQILSRLRDSGEVETFDIDTNGKKGHAAISGALKFSGRTRRTYGSPRSLASQLAQNYVEGVGPLEPVGGPPKPPTVGDMTDVGRLLGIASKKGKR